MSIQTNNYGNSRDVKILENSASSILNSLAERARAAEEVVREIIELDSLIQDEDIYYKAAIDMALEDIGLIAEEYIITETLKAAINSVEYNYSLYIQHLVNAIRLSIGEILTAKVKERDVTLNINFDVLGDLWLWESCVVAARDVLNVGKTRGKTHKESGESLALRMWREKIYKVAREGGSVSKTYKGRGKKKSGAGEKDITEKYAGLYELTIKTRLSLLATTQAPFWYIIEHGNSKLKFSDSVSDEGYPSVPPGRFINTIKTNLRERFYNLVNQYKDYVKNAIEENFRKYYKHTPEELENQEGWVSLEGEEIPKPNGWIKKRVLDISKTVRIWEYDVNGRLVKIVRYKGTIRQVIWE